MKVAPITVKVQTPWLDNKSYDGLATALVMAHVVDGEIDQEAIDTIADQITGWRNGQPTAKGYQVNTRYLLGAIKRQFGQDLVDALSANYTRPSASLDDY